MKNLLLVLIVLLLSSNVIYSQNAYPDPDYWIADGEFNDVHTICVKDEYTYIGGEFGYVGPRTGQGIKMTTIDPGIDFSYPKVKGEVYCVVSDRDGGWYIGGGFLRIDGITRNNLARIKNDGTLMDWDPDANNQVECIFYDGSHVYVGGQFLTVGGASRQRLARLDPTTGIADPFWSANAGNSVYSLFVDNSNVYVGGSFNGIKGETRQKIAKLDKINGDVDLIWIPGANNTVYSISASLVSGNATAIYAGGAFTTIAGQTISRLAKLGTTSGTPDIAFDPPNPNGTVYVVKVDGNNLYAGGSFNTIDGESISRLAKLDNSNGIADLSFNPGADNIVRDLAIDGNDLYVAGTFLNIDDAERNYIARLNKNDGIVDNSWIVDVGNYAYCIGISQDNLITNVYAGGRFMAGGEGARRKSLARIDNSTGELDMNWDPNPESIYSTFIKSLEISGDFLYVGGNFEKISDISVKNLAKIDLTGSGVPEGGWTPDPNGTVNDIIFIDNGDNIVVAGTFSSIGTQSLNKIAKINNTDGNADGSWNPAPNQDVNCIAADRDFIYAGGRFTNIGGQPRNRIAKLNNTNGNAESWDADANNTVNTIAILSSEVYAGGEFTSIGGFSRNRIAKLNNIDGIAFPWNPNANWTVNYIKPHGSYLYMGGYFSNINGFVRKGIAKLDLVTGIPSTWAPVLLGVIVVNDIELNYRGKLYMVGGFNSIGGTDLYTSPAAFGEIERALVMNSNIESHSKYAPITIEVRSSSAPYNVISSITSIGGEGLEIPSYFPNLIDNTPYYIVVKSMNTIETWSNPISFTDGILNYDFTSAITQAYGNNMILKDGLWSYYTGDPNQDGAVDLADVSLINNDAISYVTGNVATDLNGDEVVDIADLLFAYNNSINFIGAIKP